MAAKRVLRPICLDAGPPGLWRNYGKGNLSAEFKDFMRRVVDRDSNFCAYCGFRCSSHESVKNNGMEIHSLDGYDDHLELDNFVTSCNFCRMDFNLEYAGSEKKAILAYMPEMSQALVNNIVRAILFFRYYIETERQNAAAAEETASGLGGGQDQDARKLLSEVTGGINKDGAINSTIRNLLPLLDGAESLYATMKARSSLAEELLGSARPEVLGRAIVSIRNVQEMNGDRELFASARSVTSEFREKFAEYSDRLNPNLKAPGENDQTPNLDIGDILQGIRVIPTQPDCDPRAWGRPTGAFLTSMPQTWMQNYQALLQKIADQGLHIEMPVPAPAVGKDPDKPDANQNTSDT